MVTRRMAYARAHERHDIIRIKRPLPSQTGETRQVRIHILEMTDGGEKFDAHVCLNMPTTPVCA